MNYQRLILVGNATNDAELKTSKKGDVKFTTFSIGVSDAKKNTTFFPVTAFGQLGSVARYIKKGQQVCVEGRIALTEKERRLRVVADNIHLGGHRGGVAQ